MAHALVIEDDPATLQLIGDHLQQAGHRVCSAQDGAEGMALALRDPPDLLLLDWMLPGVSGPDLVRTVRQSSVTQPIVVMITARIDEQDVVEGFAAGIDDYVRKPFGVRELMCRLAALLRLARREGTSALSMGPLTLDVQQRVARVHDALLPLTPKELDLLMHLMQHEGVLRTREELLLSVWGYSHSGYARTIDSHITRLRRKLLQAGLREEVIVTMHRVGYRFQAPRGTT